MSEPTKPFDGSLLRRWSRLKTEAREKEKAGGPVKAPAAESGGIDAPEAPKAPAEQVIGASAHAAVAPGDDSLPPVESLTMDSDFSAFMQPKVDQALKRRALKQLFRDPHFNVMDGLDVYIDDYSKPDPIAPEIVRQMVQARYIFDPPPTRIDALGNVEDVPEEEIAAMHAAANATSLADTAEAGVVASDSRLPPVVAAADDAAMPLQDGNAAATAAAAGSDRGAGAAPSPKDPALKEPVAR
jgi:hypothetical protein